MTAKIFNVIFVLFCASILLQAQSWQSSRVYYNTSGRLVYVRDSLGNRIPDFSYAGYKYGEEPIPFIPVVKTISPISGDNTAHIQAAIDWVSALNPDANGIRGALLLNPGIYTVTGTIYVRTDGVVLRGSGDETDTVNNTVIWGTGDTPHQRTIIMAGGGSGTYWKNEVSGTRSNITSDTVLIGENKFMVQDASLYSVGDNIIIYHPCSANWLQAVHFGDTDSDTGWVVGEQPIVYNRIIKAIQGNSITVDVPIYNTLRKSLSQSYVYKYARTGIKRMIGIENLRVDIEAVNDTNEEHAWDAVALYQLEDSWVKNCTMKGFGQAGVKTCTATRITIDNCKAIDPQSIITGERRYNFCVYTASQQILFKNCTATNGRHHFVSNGTSWVSGIVFHNCQSVNIYSSSEGHRRWSQGMLFDNITEVNPINKVVLGLYNRGSYGTGHGWAAVNSVAWRHQAAGKMIWIQAPPTGQNYAIGCFGNIAGTCPPAPYDHPAGFIEGSNRDSLRPTSLYLAQLQDRMMHSAADEKMNDIGMSSEVELYQNYPNPFNSSTVISFSIPFTSRVSLHILDMLGREVQGIYEWGVSAGKHNIGIPTNELSSGVYIYQLVVENEFQQITILSKKFVLLK